MLTLYALISGVATLATPLAVSMGFWPVVIMRALQGVAVAINFPIMGMISFEWSTHARVGTALAWLSANLQLSSIVTMPLAGALCESSLTWRGLYYIEASERRRLRAPQTADAGCRARLQSPQSPSSMFFTPTQPHYTGKQAPFDVMPIERSLATCRNVSHNFAHRQLASNWQVSPIELRRLQRGKTIRVKSDDEPLEAPPYMAMIKDRCCLDRRRRKEAPFCSRP